MGDKHLYRGTWKYMPPCPHSRAGSRVKGKYSTSSKHLKHDWYLTQEEVCSNVIFKSARYCTSLFERLLDKFSNTPKSLGLKKPVLYLQACLWNGLGCNDRLLDCCADVDTANIYGGEADPFFKTDSSNPPEQPYILVVG